MWHDFLENPEQSEAYLQLLCQRNADGSSRYWGDCFLAGSITGSRLFTLQGAPDSQKTREQAQLYVKEALGKIKSGNTAQVSFLPDRKGLLSMKIQMEAKHEAT